MTILINHKVVEIGDAITVDCHGHPVVGTLIEVDTDERTIVYEHNDGYRSWAHFHQLKKVHVPQVSVPIFNDGPSNIAGMDQADLAKAADYWTGPRASEY